MKSQIPLILCFPRQPKADKAAALFIGWVIDSLQESKCLQLVTSYARI
jgi:hypothetical protein